MSSEKINSMGPAKKLIQTCRNFVRQLLLLTILLNIGTLFGQKDSSRLKISAVTLEFNLMAEVESYTSEANLSEFRSFVKDDPLLSQDLTGATNGFGLTPSGKIYNLPATIGFKLFSNLRHKNMQIFGGLRMGVRRERFLSFLEHVSDTTVMSFSQNGEFFFTIDDFRIAHSFQITSTVFQLPFGIQYTGDRRRRLWLSVGAELGPGITAAHRYEGFFSKGYSTSEYRIDPATGEKHLISFGRQTLFAEYSTRKKLKGIGFTGYFSVPVTINFRPLKRLSIYGQIAPGYFFTDSRYIDPRASAILVLHAGLRYKPGN